MPVETKDEQRFFITCKGYMSNGYEVDREYGPLTKMKAQEYIKYLETIDISGKKVYDGVVFSLEERNV